MDDLLWILVILVLGYFIFRFAFAKRSANQSSAPYTNQSLIGDVSTAIGNIEKQVSTLANNTSKEIGALSVTLVKNASNQAYKVSGPHSTTRVISPNLTNADFNNLASGVKGGVSIPSGYEGLVGAAVGGVIPNTVGGILQGIQTGVSAAAQLPAFKTFKSMVNYPFEEAAKGVTDVGNFVGKQAHNFENWVGHLF